MKTKFTYVAGLFFCVLAADDKKPQTLNKRLEQIEGDIDVLNDSVNDLEGNVKNLSNRVDILETSTKKTKREPAVTRTVYVQPEVIYQVDTTPLSISNVECSHIEDTTQAGCIRSCQSQYPGEDAAARTCRAECGSAVDPFNVKNIDY